MIKKILFIVLSSLFFLNTSAQQRKIKELRYLDQLRQLKNGILIVELPSRPQSSGIVDMRSKEGRAQIAREEKALALYEAVASEYSYSEFLFRFPEKEDTLYLDSFGQHSQYPTNEEHIFILEEVNQEPQVVEITYENQMGDQWIPDKEFSKKGENSQYDRSINSYDPEYIGSGGLIIRRESPFLKYETKKKRIRINYLYRSRLNSVSPVNERYEHSVEYLNRKLAREIEDYLKKHG